MNTKDESRRSFWLYCSHKDCWRAWSDSWFRPGYWGTMPLFSVLLNVWKKSERRWQSLLGLITFSSIFRLREVKSVMDTEMKQKSLCPIKKRHLFWVWMLPRVFGRIFRASHQKIKSHNAAVDPNELRVSAGSKKKVCQDKTKWLLGCC